MNLATEAISTTILMSMKEWLVTGQQKITQKQTRLPRLYIARFFILSIALLASCAVSGVARADKLPQPPLQTVLLDIAGTTLLTELAVTPVERQRGLSYRPLLERNAGMLFVYQQERPLIFTMRETSIPLSIAFINEQLEIIEILTMEPFAKENYPSSRPARYALEVNAGWFKQNGITAGAKITLQPDTE